VLRQRAQKNLCLLIGKVCKHDRLDKGEDNSPRQRVIAPSCANCPRYMYFMCLRVQKYKKILIYANFYDMKSEILNKIAEIVAEECEVSVSEIKSMCKRGDIVEARCLFVHYCYAYGLQPASITKFLDRKRKASVNDCCSNYIIFKKQSASFRLMSNQIAEKLEAIYPGTIRL